MRAFAERHPWWVAFIAVCVAVALYLIFAIWPAWLVDLIGKKKVFLNALFNGITPGGTLFSWSQAVSP